MSPALMLWRYEWTQQGRSTATFANMEREFSRFCDWWERDPVSATYADCLTYLSTLTGHRAEMAWRALRSFYSFTSATDGTANPMSKIRAPKRPEPSVKGLYEHEYKLLLGVCCGRTVTARRDTAIITLLWETGLRRSELVRLTVNDVDTDQGVLFVRKSKTDKPRLVPLSSAANVALLHYLRVRVSGKWVKHASCSALFLGQKGALTSDGVRLMLERRGESAGVHVSAHMFRRAFAVEWLELGGSQTSLQAICGWNSGAMVERYTRHARERLAATEMRRLRG